MGNIHIYLTVLELILIIVLVVILLVVGYFLYKYLLIKNAGNKETASKEKNKSFREEIALGIIILSGIILVPLIILGCVFAEKSFDHIKELFGILLPLIGTWVGTILAYYFSKQNFEAANQSVQNLVNKVIGADEKLQDVDVSDVMLKPEGFKYKSFENEKAFHDCKIQELITFMFENNIERLPILEKDTLKFIFLIYLSTLDRYLIFANHDNTQAFKTDFTIGQMLTSNFPLVKQIQTLTEKQSFLPVTATLAEASQKMRDEAICKDVFITNKGTKEEKIEGWVTDEQIAEKLEFFKKAGAKF